MKKITEFEYDSKKVILRLDLNVTIKDGKILSDEKIKASLETINYLLNHNARVIILSHLGKVKTKEDKNNNSLYKVYEKLCSYLDKRVFFSSSTRGKILEEKINNLKNGEVLLVENTRYEDLNNKAESNCDKELSKYWASLGDIFINDAFGMTHRKHASNYGISKYIPNGIGFLIEKELNGLMPLITPEHPFTIIMGGAKIEDKLDIIKGLLPKCDYLLTGGGIANSFLACNYNVGKSIKNEEKISELRDLLTKYNNKILLPIDVITSNEENIEEKNISEIKDNDCIYDIGSMTIEKYKEIIRTSRLIFVNGTMGKYEDENFSEGTKSLLEIVGNSNSIKIAGGGDALSSIEKFQIKSFDYISTGGGSTLEYISTNKIKCFDNEL